MANLIIKSSANDLVIQGSDNSPAITVGATGTTTFAENATLSGTANNLGTVTAGTIAGGNITTATTFPDGMVAQIRFKRHYVDAHHYLSSGGWQSHGDEAYFKFTFTPQSATSTILLDFFQPVTHTSSSGGWGFMAFTHDGDRNGFGGGLSGYVDTSGHWRTGFSDYAGMYHSAAGKLVYQNNSITAFELGVDVKWNHNNWYYGHSGGYITLQATEILGDMTA